jgi:hypothetical protein
MISRLKSLNLQVWLRNHLSLSQHPPLWRLIGLGLLALIAAIALDWSLLKLTPFSQAFVPQSTAQTTTPLTEVATFSELKSDPTKTVGRLISDQERQRIKEILGKNAVESSSLAPGDPPLVIIHDTSGEMSRQTILERQKQYRGPYGNGIAVYILRNGEGIITRTPFFSRYRPTATAYEKGVDLLAENVRNQEARRAWRSLSLAARQFALKGIGTVIQKEVNLDGTVLAKRAGYWLNAPSESAFGRIKGVDGGKTTALWVIGDVCNAVLAGEKAEFAASTMAVPTLQNACQKLNPIMQANRDRVMGSVNVELLQQQGSECWTTDEGVRLYNSQVAADYLKIRANRVVSLPNPTYTDAQYETLKLVYLKAALEGGRFPAIVTHYWLDQGERTKIGDHCDPRGVDLMKLYSLISQSLDHSPDTLYGSKPQYGVHPEQGDNVWWSEWVMGSPPPA